MRIGGAGRTTSGRRNVGSGVLSCLAVAWVMAPGAQGAGPASQADAASDSLVGAWAAQSYVLASGDEHHLTGRIFFTGTEWQVLFFVLDGDGVPQRGSGEGGRYATAGDRLTFMHRFNLSAGAALPGLAASPLRLAVHETATAEEARFSIADGILKIFFPSGNEMHFHRTS